MKPILMLGTAAYSPFRLDAIRAALGACSAVLSKVEIDARWVYAIQPVDGVAPDAETLDRAALLLNAENRAPDAVFFVTPRKGTISPWSSKATDIFCNCGLKGISRVERGIGFTLRLNGQIVPFESLKPSLGALYDRMTEGVYLSLDDIFDVLSPRPGRSFDVLSKGVEAIREANESLGLAISEPEMQYLADSFKAAGRNPTDTELVMFG